MQSEAVCRVSAPVAAFSLLSDQVTLVTLNLSRREASVPVLVIPASSDTASQNSSWSHGVVM